MTTLEEIDNAIKILNDWLNWYWKLQKEYFDENFAKERPFVEKAIISLGAWKMWIECEIQEKQRGDKKL